LHTPVYCSTIHNSQAIEIAKTPTTDESIKKMWYLYTMEFYLVIKKNEIVLFADKWMKLEDFILNKVSKLKKIKDCMIPLICGS
jgi:hypothetical protein